MNKYIVFVLLSGVFFLGACGFEQPELREKKQDFLTDGPPNFPLLQKDDIQGGGILTLSKTCQEEYLECEEDAKSEKDECLKKATSSFASSACQRTFEYAVVDCENDRKDCQKK